MNPFDEVDESSISFREGLSPPVYEAPSLFIRIRHAILEAFGHKPMVIIQITVDSEE